MALSPAGARKPLSDAERARLYRKRRQERGLKDDNAAERQRRKRARDAEDTAIRAGHLRAQGAARQAARRAIPGVLAREASARAFARKDPEVLAREAPARARDAATRAAHTADSYLYRLTRSGSHSRKVMARASALVGKAVARARLLRGVEVDVDDDDFLDDIVASQRALRQARGEAKYARGELPKPRLSPRARRGRLYEKRMQKQLAEFGPLE